MLCKNMIEYTAKIPQGAFEWEATTASVDPEKNREIENAFTLTFSYATSESAALAGEQSDLFIVPSLNIVFIESKVVSYDYSTCQPQVEDQIVWVLKSQDAGSTSDATGASNRDAFTVVNKYDIAYREIPNLEKLMAATTDTVGVKGNTKFRNVLE